jgi:hypothetical protein
MSEVNQAALAESEGRGAASHGFILRGFLITAASSWLVAPLGMLALQFGGLGRDPFLVSILLVMSACVPFQLLMNEYLAVSQSKGKLRVSPQQIAIIALLNCGACVVALASAKNSEWAVSIFPYGLLIPLLATGNLVMSFFSVTTYYRLMAQGRIGHRQSIINGSLTGLASLVIYVISALSGSNAILGLVLVVPGALHLSYFVWLAKSAKHNLGSPKQQGKHREFYALLSVSSAIFLASTYVSSILRIKFISLLPEFSALLLIGINVVGTAVFTLSRARFLASGDHSLGRRTASLAAVLTVATAAMYSLGSQLYLIPAMVGLHVFNVFVVESLRKWERKRTTFEKQRAGSFLVPSGRCDRTQEEV